MEVVKNTNNKATSKEHQRLKKRSKKRRFMSNAKSFGKKGIYGRGSQIEETEFTYFINILDAMKKGWESLDDKITMANNVFEQTIDKEIHLSSNQVVCKAIEALLGFVDFEHLERYMCKFKENLRPLCSDKFASHVLQKMVEIALLRSTENPQKDSDDDEPSKKKTKPNVPTEKEYNTTTNFSEDHRQTCSQFVISVGKFLLNNLEDFLWDPYANHVMRTVVNSLAGVHVTKVAFEHISGKIYKDKPLNVPGEWLDVVKDYVIRLQMWPQFPELPYNEFSSGLLGTLCIVMRDVDKNLLKSFGKKILNEAFLKIDDADEKKKIEIHDEEQDEIKSEESKLPKVFSNPSSIRLLETLLACSGPKLFTNFYALLFAGRELVLAKNRATNFSVHKLIDNMKEKVDFESVFEKLSDSLEELLKLGHTGIVSSLSGACLRFATKQATFVVSLQTALHTTGSKEKTDAFVRCLLKLKPYEITAADDSQFIHVHGSVILQNLLKFNKPIKLVQNLMDISPHDLTVIFNSPNGSFIVDAFLESKFIGEKSRDKLIRHMDGNYLDLAITKFGSIVVEKLFAAAVDAQKLKIIKELSDKVNQLNGTMFGRLLFHKFRVETYKLSPTQWKAAYDRANKAEKLLKDIVDK